MTLLAEFLIAISGVTALFAIGSVLNAWRINSGDVATRRALKCNKRIAVAAIKDGSTVSICGRLAYAAPPLVAPLSGRRCAAWEVTVVQWVENGEDAKRWEVVVSEQRSQDFYLDDGTGRALITARSPMMALHRDVRFTSGPSSQAAPELEAFLARHGLSREYALGYELVWHEGVLEEGEQVAVLGAARLEADPDGVGTSYRDGALRVVVDEPDEDPLMLSDSRAVTG